MCNVAPVDAASRVACSTATAAVSEPSVPTMMTSYIRLIVLQLRPCHHRFYVPVPTRRSLTPYEGPGLRGTRQPDVVEPRSAFCDALRISRRPAVTAVRRHRGCPMTRHHPGQQARLAPGTGIGRRAQREPPPPSEPR